MLCDIALKDVLCLYGIDGICCVHWDYPEQLQLKYENNNNISAEDECICEALRIYARKRWISKENICELSVVDFEYLKLLKGSRMVFGFEMHVLVNPVMFPKWISSLWLCILFTKTYLN